MKYYRLKPIVIAVSAVLLLLAAWPVKGQQQFIIEVDTLYLTAGEEMSLNFDDYSLRYKDIFPFYEDDRYIALYERGFGCGAGGNVVFEEKETSWYPVTKNGWLQYEPVHRRYLCDGAPGRIILTDSAYYLVYPDRVCSFGIGEAPGQIGYLNELPKDDFWGFEHEKWYCPDKEDYYKTVVHCPHIRYHRNKPDTCIEQAFCVDNRIYCIVTTPETTSIERVDNGRFELVVDLGRRFDFTNGFYPWWQLDDHLTDFNRNNDGCRLVFSDAFHNGTLTVKDYTVHIRYVRLNVLP